MESAAHKDQPVCVHILHMCVEQVRGAGALSRCVEQVRASGDTSNSSSSSGSGSSSGEANKAACLEC